MTAAGISSHLAAVAEAQAARFGGLWAAKDAQQADRLPPIRERRHLGPLSADQMRATATRWSWGTAVCTDGFRMRHYALLSDAALDTLAVIFKLSSSRGTDHRSGVRCAGGGRCRRGLCEEWEAGHCDSFFAASAGRDLLGPVLQAAVLDEAADAQGQVAASAFLDVAAFLDTLPHEVLSQAARESGFDEVPLEVGLAACCGSRYLSVGGVTRKSYSSTTYT